MKYTEVREQIAEAAARRLGAVSRASANHRTQGHLFETTEFGSKQAELVAILNQNIAYVLELINSNQDYLNNLAEIRDRLLAYGLEEDE